MNQAVEVVDIQKRIFTIRDKQVMFDNDLARLYGVTTGNLNKAVNRNIARFPGDFMFRLHQKEYDTLRFHFGSSKGCARRGGRRYLPYVFTQEGVAMLSGVLKTKRAVQINILIMRAFVRLRELLISHKDLARKIEKIEEQFEKRFEDHDKKITAIFQAIRKLLEEPPTAKKEPIGFHARK